MYYITQCISYKPIHILLVTFDNQVHVSESQPGCPYSNWANTLKLALEATEVNPYEYNNFQTTTPKRHLQNMRAIYFHRI